MDKKCILELIKDYRNAEETEEYDEFHEKHGDAEEVMGLLMSFIEGETK